MAYVLQTPVLSTRDGVNPFPSAAVSQISWVGSENELLFVKNASASSLTVTLKVNVSVDGTAVADKTVTVAAGATKVIGPFPRYIYHQSDDTVHVDFSATASITFGVIKFGTLNF